MNRRFLLSWMSTFHKPMMRSQKLCFFILSRMHHRLVKWLPRFRNISETDFVFVRQKQKQCMQGSWSIRIILRIKQVCELLKLWHIWEEAARMLFVSESFSVKISMNIRLRQPQFRIPSYIWVSMPLLKVWLKGWKAQRYLVQRLQILFWILMV